MPTSLGVTIRAKLEGFGLTISLVGMKNVESAYSHRASEYIEHLGTPEAVHPSDRQLIRTWAKGTDGPVLDAGCGPGHWTNYMVSQGASASGVDLVHGFISSARTRFPDIHYEVGSIDQLDVESGSLGGILCWYSLIHHSPDTVRGTLTEFARTIRPDGGLLLGFFDGPAIESFDHAVITAYRWPVNRMALELNEAGFDVVETHTRTGEGYRPHAAIVAQRASSPSSRSAG